LSIDYYKDDLFSASTALIEAALQMIVEDPIIAALKINSQELDLQHGP
jgi:hypothetical protein